MSEARHGLLDDERQFTYERHYLFAQIARTTIWKAISTMSCVARKSAHAESRTRVTSMGGLYDTATLHAPMGPMLGGTEQMLRIPVYIAF